MGSFCRKCRKCRDVLTERLHYRCFKKYLVHTTWEELKSGDIVFIDNYMEGKSPDPMVYAVGISTHSLLSRLQGLPAALGISQNKAY